eukprot:m.101475 g.101475  ORF g.101475 m.101475 type:complete len:436 (+) comp51493_c0_seq2:189-1496(+)
MLPHEELPTAGEETDGSERATLLWSPALCTLNSQQVDEFLQRAEQLQYGPEIALSTLFEAEWSVDEAFTRLQALPPRSLDGRDTYQEKWTATAVKTFEHLVRGGSTNYGGSELEPLPSKQFPLISRATGRTVPECVEFYYFWKKSPRADRLKRASVAGISSIGRNTHGASSGPRAATESRAPSPPTTFLRPYSRKPVVDIEAVSPLPAPKPAVAPKAVVAPPKAAVVPAKAAGAPLKSTVAASKASPPTASNGDSAHPPRASPLAATRQEEKSAVDSGRSTDTAKRKRDVEEMFNVEKILGMKRSPDGTTKYLVKWEGYSDTTWEPKKHLAGNIVFKEFLKSSQKEREAEKEKEERGRAKISPGSRKAAHSPAHTPPAQARQQKPLPPPPSLLSLVGTNDKGNSTTHASNSAAHMGWSSKPLKLDLAQDDKSRRS